VTPASTSALACTRCHGELEPEDLRCPLCGLAAEDHSASAPTRARADVLRCNGCGAALSYSAEHRAAKCGFCGSSLRVEAPSDPIEQAEQVLPFRVGEEQARRALTAWLGSRGFFRPSDLASASTVAEMKPLFWAAWLFDAKATISYTADSNAGARQASWAPHAGQTSMTFTRLVVPGSRGLAHEETAQLVPRYDIGTAQPASDAATEPLIERFELQRSAARRKIVDAIRATAAADVLSRGLLPGTRFRNVKVAVLLQHLETRRVAFPAWVLAYRYRGKLHRAIVHGHDAALVLGTSPISIAKVLLAVLGVAAGAALVIAAVLAASYLAAH
jgi:hypothetical protein